MDRSELRPALMRRSVSFTRSCVRKLSWLRIQRMINLRKRSQEFIHEGMMWWTGGRSGWIATYGLGNRLKAEGLFRCQHRGRQNTGSPGCCSYLEDCSSTDRAFSFLFDFRPVFCLLFRHRISFQPLGGLNLNPLLVVLTLTRRVLLSSYLAPES